MGSRWRICCRPATGYQGHNNDLGSYNSATGQWQIGSLEVGEGAVLEVETLVNGSGGFLSSASASSFSEDPEPFNNLAFAEVDPFTDLAVSIEADAEWAGMGDVLAMTVEVSNAGSRAADAVSVQVTPPVGRVSSPRSISPRSVTTSRTRASGPWGRCSRAKRQCW